MFLKNVIKVGSGNILAQAISLAAVPVITRLYSPEDYGVFATFLAIVMILTPLTTLRLNSALVLPEKSDEALNLLLLSFLSVVVTCLLLAGGLAVGAGLLHHFGIRLFPGELSEVLWLLPLNVFVLGIYQVAVSWSIREKQFGVLSVSRISQSVADRGCVIGLTGVVSAHTWGLIAGRIVGPAVSVIVLLKKGLLGGEEKLLKAVNFDRIFNAARRYKDFALFATWSSLFDASSRQVPVLLMSYLFLPEVVGYYALAMQVINLPMLMVGDAIANVFLQRAAELREDKDSLTREAADLLEKLLLLIIPSFLFLAFLGGDCFKVFFGDSWIVAGEFAQILSLAFLLMFLHRPFSMLFDVLEIQKSRLFFDATIFVSRTLVVLLGAWLTDNPFAVMVGLTLVTVLIYSLGLVFLCGKIGLRVSRLTGILSKCLLYCVPVMICMLFISNSDFNSFGKISLNIILVLIQTSIPVFLKQYLALRNS